MTYEEAIRQRRARGAAAISPRRYSPQWWTGRLRAAANAHQPHYVVIHDDGGMREFVALGGMPGANAALEQILGPEVTTKADLDRLLYAANRRLLDVLPDEGNDDLDRFIVAHIEKLARHMRGCGFDTIQAKVKLEALCEMSYSDIRAAAAKSPDYAGFRDSFAAACSTES